MTEVSDRRRIKCSAGKSSLMAKCHSDDHEVLDDGYRNKKYHHHHRHNHHHHHQVPVSHKRTEKRHSVALIDQIPSTSHNPITYTYNKPQKHRASSNIISQSHYKYSTALTNDDLDMSNIQNNLFRASDSCKLCSNNHNQKYVDDALSLISDHDDDNEAKDDSEPDQDDQYKDTEEDYKGLEADDEVDDESDHFSSIHPNVPRNKLSSSYGIWRLQLEHDQQLRKLSRIKKPERYLELEPNEGSDEALLMENIKAQMMQPRKPSWYPCQESQNWNKESSMIERGGARRCSECGRTSGNLIKLSISKDNRRMLSDGDKYNRSSLGDQVQHKLTAPMHLLKPHPSHQKHSSKILTTASQMKTSTRSNKGHHINVDSDCRG